MAGMFGPIEGLTGILMGGLSAGLFVTLVNGIFAAVFQQTSWNS